MKDIGSEERPLGGWFFDVDPDAVPFGDEKLEAREELCGVTFAVEPPPESSKGIVTTSLINWQLMHYDRPVSVTRANFFRALRNFKRQYAARYYGRKIFDELVFRGGEGKLYYDPMAPWPDQSQELEPQE